jgi:hypothetical protein
MIHFLYKEINMNSLSNSYFYYSLDNNIIIKLLFNFCVFFYLGKLLFVYSDNVITLLIYLKINQI